jgi:hypothetical protein
LEATQDGATLGQPPGQLQSGVQGVALAALRPLLPGGEKRHIGQCSGEMEARQHWLKILRSL